jgi:hypothetical protein
MLTMSARGSPGQDVFGAIAVVHIKVHHRHTLQVVALQRIFGRHGHVVEKAKPHGLVAAGMVAGRAHRAKGVFQISPAITASVAARAAPAERSAARQVWAFDRGVGIELRVGGATRQQFFVEQIGQAAHGRHVQPVVRQFDVGQRGLRGFVALQRIGHAGDQQAVFDGVQPLGAFRMAGPHFVFAAVRVGEIACFAHSEIPVSLFSDNVTPCMHSKNQISFGSA